MKSLEQLATHYPEATLYIGRELTKFHEEMLVGTPAEIIDILTNTPVKQKGEFVVILSF
jgi:16S rRNA (cytidine1402-2'-O)-methyltransferase